MEQSGADAARHRALLDQDLTLIGAYLTDTYDFGDCPLAACRAAIYAAAHKCCFDELKDWFDALPEWDGKPRLDNWLADYCGADTIVHTPEYLAMVSSKFPMQVLHRALNPGSKADYALVLTGPQGAGKDEVLAVTFEPYYSEAVPSPRLKQADFALASGRQHRRAFRGNVGLEEVRRRRPEGGTDAPCRPRTAGIRV